MVSLSHRAARVATLYTEIPSIVSIPRRFLEGGGVHEHLWRVMLDGKVYECDSFVEHGSGKVLAASSKQLNRLNDFGPGKKLEWVYDSVDFGLTVVSTQ